VACNGLLGLEAGGPLASENNRATSVCSWRTLQGRVDIRRHEMSMNAVCVYFLILYGKIKLILKKVMRVWTGLIWPWIETSGGLFWRS
jgi:hypothetical protein